jgi:hypothetical protein
MCSLISSLGQALKSLQGGFCGSREQNDALLRPLLILLIVALAGPDLFAATELTTLLDLLGATLFLLAYISGFKLLGISFLHGLRRLFVPNEYLMLIGLRGQPYAIACGLLFLTAHCAILLSLGFFGVAILTHLGQLA